MNSRNELLRKKLWVYNHGKRRFSPESLSRKIIQALYLSNKKTPRELYGLFGWDVYANLTQLKKREIVEKNRHDRTYELTDLGQWFAISFKLGLSFAELCALACACCVQARYASTGKIGFYMQSAFGGILKEYYSKQYVTIIFSSLRSKGFAVKYVKKTLRIYPKTCADLMARYGEQFRKLEAWLDNLEEKKVDIVSRALEDLESGSQD
ncbi:MAG: hypothetical protein ACREBA_00475 [Nitrosotalea sp.]